MSQSKRSRFPLRVAVVSGVMLLAAVAVMIWSTGDHSELASRAWFGRWASEGEHDAGNHDDHQHGPADRHGEHDHSEHDHDVERAHSSHGEVDSIELSSAARSNLGLKTQPLTTGSFTEYTEVPAVVTAWPGRTHVAVTSPLTGVINSIHVGRGELIQGGEPMFTLRLTHQDLVNTQQQFLTQLGQLDVAEKEIERLESVASSGAVAGKTRIAREYERDNLLAGIRAARQAMLLHGLNEKQVEQIEQTRQLVREVIVRAPEMHEDESLHHDSLGSSADMRDTRFASMMQPPSLEHPRHLDVEYLVTELAVRRGQSVAAGETLAELSDYSELLIEGHAYQRDAKLLREAANSSASVQAVLGGSDQDPKVLNDLRIVYIGNEVGRQSRTLPFYVGLSNQIERSEVRGEKRYVSWTYKPGQRLQLRLPVTTLRGVVVLPKHAIAEEGPERYLFVDRGDHFDRVPVQIVGRDALNVAVALTPQLQADQEIVVRGTHQLQMAFENRGGGAIDPHAGHSH